MNKTLNEHKYPDYFLNHPGLIRVLYATCYLSQFRKWYLQPLIAKILRQMPDTFTYLDIGGGEGQFLFPFAAKYPNASFIGLDKNQNNIDFYNTYIRKRPFNNVTAIQGDVEDSHLPTTADIAVCIGVIHFVNDDVKALKSIYNMLKPSGRLLLQVPVNGEIVLPYYRTLLKRFGNYDTIQTRKRFYLPAEIKDKVKLAGFTITREIHTYGFWGKLAHELFNIPFLYYINGGIAHKIAAFIAFNVLFPFIMLFYVIDYCIVGKTTGNGVILVCEKAL